MKIMFDIWIWNRLRAEFTESQLAQQETLAEARAMRLEIETLHNDMSNTNEGDVDLSIERDALNSKYNLAMESLEQVTSERDLLRKQIEVTFDKMKQQARRYTNFPFIMLTILVQNSFNDV